MVSFCASLVPTADIPDCHRYATDMPQLMVDKLIALRRDRIRQRIGALQPPEMRLLDRALRLWLALDEG